MTIKVTLGERHITVKVPKGANDVTVEIPPNVQGDEKPLIILTDK